MASPPAVIPKRALFKAAEVCDIAKVQPFILKSWEAEFPNLGISRTPSGPRFYRQVDVERVLQIKHLLFVEGLTLSGARRRLDGEAQPVSEDLPPIRELLREDARARLAKVKEGLQAILQLLSNGQEASSGPRRALEAERPRAGASASRGATSRGRRVKTVSRKRKAS